MTGDAKKMKDTRFTYSYEIFCRNNHYPRIPNLYNIHETIQLTLLVLKSDRLWILIKTFTKAKNLGTALL